MIDVYQSVTDRIIASLEEGTIPWKKPWVGSGPRNVENGRHYSGINVFLLTLAPFGDPRWGTYKAIKRAGGQVRRGETSTQIVLLKRVNKRVIEAITMALKEALGTSDVIDMEEAAA